MILHHVSKILFPDAPLPKRLLHQRRVVIQVEAAEIRHLDALVALDGKRLEIGRHLVTIVEQRLP